MALTAAQHWHTEGDVRVADVGGAGSPFARILRDFPGGPPHIIDPLADTGTIQEYSGDPHDAFDVIFALSVLEHVPDVDDFLAACVWHLAPGGLLFLTVDIWDKEGPDTAHFHWMRERIFTLQTWHELAYTLSTQGMTLFGEEDGRYHGDQLYASYSFASLAMMKEPTT